MKKSAIASRFLDLMVSGTRLEPNAPCRIGAVIEASGIGLEPI